VTQHQQVTVRVGDLEADVDEGMAELVKACWRAGIGTEESCEEVATNSGMARLAFDTLGDMEHFYEAVRDECDDLPDAWRFELWADGGLLGFVVLPRERLAWAASRLAAISVTSQTP
jgi:hypothetical protein